MFRSSFWVALGAGLLASTAFAQDAETSDESAASDASSTHAVSTGEGASGPDPRDARMRELEERLARVEVEQAADQAADEAAVTAAAPAAVVPPAPSHHTPEPWAWADFSWAPGNYGPIHPALSHTDGELSILGEIRMDAVYHYSFADFIDDTISGSSEVFRHGEL